MHGINRLFDFFNKNLSYYIFKFLVERYKLKNNIPFDHEDTFESTTRSTVFSASQTKQMLGTSTPITTSDPNHSLK